MKKRTIWLIAIVMGISFITLLYLQYQYFDVVIKLRKEQFDETVSRSLFQAAQNLELNETNIKLHKKISMFLDNESKNIDMKPNNTIQGYKIKYPILKYIEINANEKGNKHSLKSIEKRLLQSDTSLYKLLYSALYEPNNTPLQKRILNLDSELKHSLINNGINLNSLSYHFCVTNSIGDTIYKCPDYNSNGSEISYVQDLFPTESKQQMGILHIHFPELKHYLYSGVQFMIPTVIFTFILLCIFIFTIYIIFRQKRLTEIKNDFINNMTHEFKTPISSISLAAQMLKDPNLHLTQSLIDRTTSVIVDETKRLRFQVEKVLQMSMFDQNVGTFKRKIVDMNHIIEEATNTFRLRLESMGGNIKTDLIAHEHFCMIDKMHMTNVIFNIMDNAVKYKSPDRPLYLRVSSYNNGKYISISIQDNGIGIKKDDLKKIFEKFYRSQTGNRHDVKGFGLGLAYVKKVVTYHKGFIHAESEYGKGTTFIINLPYIKET